MNLLEIYALRASYNKKPILNDCALFLQEFEILSIVGESGSGKSTILKIIFGIAKPQDRLEYSGKITVNGKDHKSGKNPQLQLIYQEPSLTFNPSWTLEECLLEPALLLRQPKEIYKKELLKWLDKFHISEKALFQNITRFSGGELQRIAMIRAILSKPKIICMDEPVSGLDRIVLLKTISYIKELKHAGVSVLLVSHDLEFVKNVSDRVYILEKGSFVESGDAIQVFENPKHEYTKALLKARDLTGIRNKFNQ